VFCPWLVAGSASAAAAQQLLQLMQAMATAFASVDHPTVALDLLARIVPVRINAGPPFPRFSTLWLSMMAAVGLASR
jgi:hypothetical protein